ncbi:MAG: helix-turn-helix transcriptional regulator [Geobacteraceae bacterium]|nr:helix-turn-helix transcriptional regulator [Geobacteraceae bacterium]
MDKKNVGTRIRKIRVKLGYNQTEFGKLIDASNASVSAYENGDSYAPIGTLIKIAQLAGVSIEWIIMGEEVSRETLMKLLSEEEIRLLVAFNRADPEDRKMILRIAEAVVSSNAQERNGTQY